ncbi:CoA transferase subunit A [Pseudovibrio flavus]|uniref:CoA transferase subunit A n=1 Tax=Pseudovibrio flavus TaxID=2529854 RepID=UPI00211CC172|nr:CoA transferase subunit A [Pseudovibrio flavus]
MLLDKKTTIEEAIGRIKDGDSVMLGGFGVPGTPFCLIQELVRQGQKDLTVIKNDANEKGMGVDWLLENGQVRKLITSHIGLNARAVELKNNGSVEIEFVAQGILAERVRAAGAGLMGFVSDIGIDTEFADGKQQVELNGKVGLLEPAINADFALVHAQSADSFGNLRFSGTAMNFNPLMAMAADTVIVETESYVALGDIQPEDIHCPGPFTDAIVELSDLPEVYGVVQR